MAGARYRRIVINRAFHEWVKARVGPADKVGLALLERMERALDATELKTLPASKFVTMLQKKLGDRLAMLPNPGPAWWAKVQRALVASGLDEAAAEKVVQAAYNLRPPISVEFVLSRLPTLFAATEADAGRRERPARPEGWAARKEFDTPDD